MKLAITFVAVGILGISQYIYFQFTPLALNYSFTKVATEEIAGHTVVTEFITTVSRDWTLGIIPAIVGVGLIIWGSLRLRNKRRLA